MKTTIDLPDTLVRQADGLSMFRRNPAVAPQIPSLQELLELEHTTLAAEDQQRAGFPGSHQRVVGSVSVAPSRLAA